MTQPHHFLMRCIFTLAIVGCTSANTTAATAAVSFSEDTLTLALGAEATTRDGGLRVRFVQLVNESRCPANVTCVWEGDAAVKLTGATRSTAAEATIHTAVDPRVMDVAGYRLSLLDVLPYPGTPDSARAKSVVVRVVRPAR